MFTNTSNNFDMRKLNPDEWAKIRYLQDRITNIENKL